MLSQVSDLQLPQRKLEDLYEQVILEMAEAKELDVARTLLRQTHVMSVLRKENEARYLRLEGVVGRVYAEGSDLYGLGSSKEKRRAKLATDLAQEVSIIPPSRLMTIVGQALKWQRQQGALPASAEIDLLRGVAVGKVDDEEKCPASLGSTVKFGKDCHVECAAFSPDGLVLATGSVDGFLEIWDTTNGYKLKVTQRNSTQRNPINSTIHPRTSAGWLTSRNADSDSDSDAESDAGMPLAPTSTLHL